jgi:uncharacterized SAM-binding protein YcdF (DUF218 family)
MTCMIELLKSLATPVVWVLGLMVLSLVLTRRPEAKRRRKLGRYVLFLGILILAALSTRPASELLLYSLESRYEVPSTEVLSTLDVVVVLGGGMTRFGGFGKVPEPSGVAYSRVCNAVRIFKQSGAKTLAFSGGDSEPGALSEAEVMRALALEFGVPGGRIVTETKSRDTMENAALLAKLLPSTKPRRIGLVTSALHMPRSVKVFRHYFRNDTIIPVPVNHLCSPDWSDPKSYIPSSDTLARSNCAIHEWIGMIWYFLRHDGGS